jgi:FAD/FMN-containing dehydrogenase
VVTTSTKDVAAVVAFCHANSLDLAVKGGGHYPPPASSTDGGVCIDLSKMQKISVDVKAKTIKVQGGAIWGAIRAAAQKYGLGLPGGACNQVGVGGSTLAGGHGFVIWCSRTGF